MVSRVTDLGLGLEFMVHGLGTMVQSLEKVSHTSRVLKRDALRVGSLLGSTRAPDCARLTPVHGPCFCDYGLESRKGLTHV